jgi:DNA (cytosine-5)-methyltransferase 1
MIARNTHTPATMFDELIVDNFAGGGGASIGIERAMGRAVDVAVNHSPEAVAMHRVNHPATLHLCQDVWAVDPIKATAGRPVGLAWFSPDCTHFSKARGGKPIRTTKSRDLAWVVIRWAATVRPRVIMLENVEEFQTWGPLVDGRPCPRRKGKTFRSWTKQLRDLGYEVQWRELRACDYGAPTIRKRLFLIARCDGLPIVWPEVTHGVDNARDSSGTDGSGSARSTQGQGGRDRQKQGPQDQWSGQDNHGDQRGRRSERGGRVRLKPYRTAAECIDWSIPCPSIFDRKRPLADNTLKRIAAGIKRYVIDAAEPFIVQLNHHGGDRVHSLNDPLNTVQASSREGKALVVPTIIGAGGSAYAGKPVALNRPIGTIKCEDRRALVSAFLAGVGGRAGQSRPRGVDEPTATITAKADTVLAAAHMIKLRGTCKDGQPLDQPAPTMTASGTHAGLVAALLVKFYGNDQHGQSVNEPIHTLPTKDRFGLVTVHIHGEPYVITDIGMRMLQPHELYAAQGFPPGYIIDHGIDADGRRVELTKTAQVRLCGNSVSPPVAEALVRANMAEQLVMAGEVASV